MPANPTPPCSARAKRYRDLVHADGVSVGLWNCNLGNLKDGPERLTTVATVNVPIQGAYLRRGPAGDELVDPLTCSFSNPGDTWCTRHPTTCRDTGIYVLIDATRLDARFESSFRRLSPADWLDWRVYAASLGVRPAPDAGDAAMLLVERQLNSAPTAVCEELALEARSRLARGDLRSVEALAVELGVSPFVLCRSFRRATGTTAHAWLDRLRAIRAADAIVAGARDLAGLALDLGFAHHSHLAWRVRRVFGCTPTEVRARVQRAQLARM